MAEYQNLVSFIQDLHVFLARHPGMKEKVVDMVETYRMCRQRSHGDLPPDVTLGPGFEEMYAHVFSENGGCQWCRSRVEKLERIKLSESAQLIEQIIQGITPQDL
jgi:hypothetical protein